MTVGREGLTETQVEIYPFLGLTAKASKQRCPPESDNFGL